MKNVGAYKVWNLVIFLEEISNFLGHYRTKYHRSIKNAINFIHQKLKGMGRSFDFFLLIYII